jgi:hypothetical protein
MSFCNSPSLSPAPFLIIHCSIVSVNGVVLTNRHKIKTIGKSYSIPVLRSPASEPLTGKQDCGEYDCYQSRRVEINFTLKDDTKVIDSLYKLKRGQI